MSFFSSLFLISFLCGPDTTSYPKWEEENMSLFRTVISFEMPVVEGIVNTGVHRTELPLSGGDDALKTEWPNELSELLLRSKEKGANAQLEGYRIQIYSGADLEEANKLRADFLEQFPGYSAYRLWIQPTFRVRIGDFSNRNDAIQFTNDIKPYFPGAFVVPDKIERPKVKKPKILEEESIEIEPGE